MINRRLFGILAALPAALGPLDTRAQTEVPDSTLPETARELGPSSTASEKDPAPTAPAPAPGQFMVRLEGGDPRVPAELLIDGWSVGLLPWSGSLPPGARTFAVRQGELGTAPMPATGGGEQVVQAQSLEPLGPELRLSSEPAYADLWLNDVRLSNPWLGRLPLGKQVLRASQPGGPAVSHVFEVTASAPKVLVLHLDGSGASQTGSKTLKHAIELVPAFLIGSSMGSETEETCGEFQCTNRTPALGGLGYVRFSLSFARKMRFELSAGVVYLTSKLERQFTDDTLPDFEPVTYDLSDKLRVRGPFVSTGLAFQHSVAKNVDLGGRLALGLSQMFSRHRTEGTLSADAGSGTVAVSHSDAVERNVMLFGMPELFVGYHESLWRFGAGFGAFVIMNRAALSKHGEIWPEQRQSAPCDGIGCAPPSNAIAGERPFGPSALVSMSLYAGLAF